jgi:predicted nucleotide-binding protein
MTNKTEILRRLEEARSRLREWQRETGFKGIDIPREWIGEIGGTLEALNPNTAREFYDLARGALSDDVGTGDLEDFFAKEIGRLRSEIALGTGSPTNRVRYPRSPRGNRVFLVHGHDEGSAQTVARFVEKLGLEIVILHEHANEGRTLIEKFLAHAEGVDFAIALWTADDEGHARTEENLKPRARQNVVFETGFFIGALGRERVCVIYEPGIELPSDYVGVIYVPKSDWKAQLLRELRAAKLPVDPSASS